MSVHITFTWGGPATFNGIDGFGMATGMLVPSIPTLIVTEGSGGGGSGSLLATVAPVTTAPTDPLGGPRSFALPSEDLPWLLRVW